MYVYVMYVCMYVCQVVCMHVCCACVFVCLSEYDYGGACVRGCVRAYVTGKIGPLENIQEKGWQIQFP